MGKISTLSKKQIEVIRLILNENSITAAARKAGIGKSTVYRWLKRRVFKERLETSRAAVFAEAIAALKAAAGAAVDKLVLIMGSKDEGESRRAATTVLELSFKAVEIDEYETRISTLEDRIAGGATDRGSGGPPKGRPFPGKKSDALASR